MRKIIVSLNLTLDGQIASADGGLNWHLPYWTEEMASISAQQLAAADTILLGRVTYEKMERYWPQISQQLTTSREDLAYSDMMNQHQKIVVSRTLVSSNWNNSIIINKNIRSAVQEFKNQPGKDIILFGSRSLIGSLLRWNLVDEFRFWIHPVMLGKGKPLFTQIIPVNKFYLTYTKVFSSGVVLLHYEVEVKDRVLTPSSFTPRLAGGGSTLRPLFLYR